MTNQSAIDNRERQRQTDTDTDAHKLALPSLSHTLCSSLPPPIVFGPCHLYSHYPVFHQTEGVRLFSKDEARAASNCMHAHVCVYVCLHVYVCVIEPPCAAPVVQIASMVAGSTQSADASTHRTDECQETHSAAAAAAVGDDLRATLSGVVHRHRHTFFLIFF